jgi:PspA-Associated protein
MIVRISGEDQFRLDSSHEARLQELDEAVLAALERGDEAAFNSSLSELLDFVRASGAPLGEDELEASDLILPPPDTTLEEAANDFSGEGWLPD